MDTVIDHQENVRNYHTESERIDAAQLSRRCAHIKYNGERCGCPALSQKEFCHFHFDAESQQLHAPLLEDAAALQIAIMRVIRAIEMEMIDNKKAYAMLYALQLASSNLNRLRQEIPVEENDREDLVMRLLRLIDPPPERHGYVCQDLIRLVDKAKR